MGLQGYVGSAEDQSRIRRLEKEREEERQRLETAKKEATSQPAGFRNWRQGTIEKAETAFRQETIGLISREDYIQKKESVKQRLAAESYAKKRKQHEQEHSQQAAKRVAKEQQRKQAKLSFLDDEDEDADDDDPGGHREADGGPRPSPARLIKNSEVPTGFLPDNARDLAIEKARQELQRQWSEEQEQLKQSKLTVPFSYWDGSGHQRETVVAVGDTIEDFLKMARGVMERDFPQLRHTAVSNLMVVAHNIMLPQACSFHKLIVGKARNGKGEVLFDLDDKKKSAHSIKVLLRSWYESNKHIYPANRWQLFDEDAHIP